MDRWTLSRSLAALLLMVWATAAWAEPEAGPRWEKPVKYSAALMGVGIVGLIALDENDEDPDFSNFAEAFRDGPAPDDDSDFLNFVLHPLWGSETYLRAREADFGVWGSVGFNIGASVFWEFFVESFTERPSTQDLITTTVAGVLIGEFRYYLKQNSDPRYYWLIDPINTGLDHFGLGFWSDTQANSQPTLTLTWDFN